MYKPWKGHLEGEQPQFGDENDHHEAFQPLTSIGVILFDEQKTSEHQWSQDEISFI